MDVSNRRIVILGKTGAGKSSLANTIFGEKLFLIDHTVSSGTIKCEAETKSVNGRSITLIDTPGFFDTDRSEDEMKTEIVRCITECAPGPHAFLIVLEVNKFTELEQTVIDKINKYFSEEAFKYATLVFTHGDQLPEGQTIEDFVLQNKKKNKLVSDLVKKCGGRCHVIDNKYWNQKPKDEYRSNQFQVEELLKTIEKMVMENNGSCYTNEMLQTVEEEIEQEEEKIRHQKSSGNMSEKQIREKAKANVSTKLWVRLAGFGTGVLLGALCGGAGMVPLVVKSMGTPNLASAAGTAAVLGASAIVGGVLGGFRGYYASEGADTAWEAMKTVAGTVKNEAEPASTGANDVLEKISQPRTQGSEKSNRRIVILGKTGAGKSSLANTIFGERVFLIDHTANSGTSKCEAETKSVNGRSVTLIDCPGLFDTDRSEDEMKREIVRCFTECAPGPHAFLIVLKVEKFTEQENTVINKINEYFSEEAFRYATVVFTHGDQLPEGQTIEDFVHQNKLLSDLVKKCGGRCHVIDNKYWNQKPKQDYRSNQFQVEKLLNTIEKMVMENKGSCYTNETLQAVEEEIKQEEEKIRHQKSSGNMSEEEIQEQAKANVSTKLWVRLAGVGTGVLLGALCGVAVIVAGVHMRAPDLTSVAGGETATAAAFCASAAVGGMMGGLAGYEAVEGADTAWIAVKTAAGTVKNEAESAFHGANDFLEQILQQNGRENARLDRDNNMVIWEYDTIPGHHHPINAKHQE